MILISLISSASIIACDGTSHHIVALEEDKDIFNAFLKPMRKSTQIVVTA
jgi:hypothetical protein